MTFTFKTLHQLQSLNKMERTRVTIITLACILFFENQRIFGTEVNMRVKSGDSITLFCDRHIPVGSNVIWIRNCSLENQPSLVLDPHSLFEGTFPRFSFVKNSSSNSFDLHIENISASDQGLYYCAKTENNINKDDRGIIRSKEEYQYGDRRTRLSLLDPVCPCADPSSTTSPPPVSDCVLCWTLLFSVCPVCVLLSSLLSSTCVYCLCQKKTTDGAADQKEKMKHRITVEDDEVCYASLDVMTRRQKRLKKKSIQSSDFSTYAAVKTEAV